jgi:hypothetical protein
MTSSQTCLKALRACSVPPFAPLLQAPWSVALSLAERYGAKRITRLHSKKAFCTASGACATEKVWVDDELPPQPAMSAPMTRTIGNRDACRDIIFVAIDRSQQPAGAEAKGPGAALKRYTAANLMRAAMDAA